MVSPVPFCAGPIDRFICICVLCVRLVVGTFRYLQLVTRFCSHLVAATAAAAAAAADATPPPGNVTKAKEAKMKPTTPAGMSATHFHTRRGKVLDVSGADAAARVSEAAQGACIYTCHIAHAWVCS